MQSEFSKLFKMGVFRGQKLFQDAAARVRRGVKQLPSAIRRGAKFVKDLPSNIAKSDTALRKTSNTLKQIGDYGMMAGAATGFMPLAEAGLALHGVGGKINDFRHSQLANRLRSDFSHGGPTTIMGTTAAADNAKANRAAFRELPGFA